MCGHAGERMVNVWILDDKGEKTPAYFSVDCCKPETNTVYQFHRCHWHQHTCTENRTKRQKLRYKDTCQIDWLIANNGWDTKYNLSYMLLTPSKFRFLDVKNYIKPALSYDA